MHGENMKLLYSEFRQGRVKSLHGSYAVSFGYESQNFKLKFLLQNQKCARSFKCDI